MVATTVLSPIVVEEDGTAHIEGTGFKVVHIAIDEQMGRTPAEIQEAHPHLTLSQIHAALSYYYAHQEQLDAEIAEGDRLYQEGYAAQMADPDLPARQQALIERYQQLTGKPWRGEAG